MRIGLTSDFHGNLPDEVPDCDVLFIGGDVCPLDDHSHHHQRYWLKKTFAPWLESLPMTVVGIAGNHDFVAELPDGYNLMSSLPWLYLEDHGDDVHGLQVYGTPYSNQFGRWAFMEEEHNLATRWDWIPAGVDVLMVHGPAYGLLDRVNNNWGDAARDKHVGSRSLRETVLDRKPKVFLCGHIHEGHGEATLGDTIVVNGSYCDETYTSFNPIRVVEI